EASPPSRRGSRNARRLGGTPRPTFGVWGWGFLFGAMSRILFILSGSIACYKACEVISQLVQRGHQVRAVATPAALRFVGVATLEGLTREKAATDLFETGRALDHIELTRWAEVVLLCPATANTL